MHNEDNALADMILWREGESERELREDRVGIRPVGIGSIVNEGRRIKQVQRKNVSRSLIRRSKRPLTPGPFEHNKRERTSVYVEGKSPLEACKLFSNSNSNA